MNAIGKIQTKCTKCCTICMSSVKRTIAVKITEKTDEQINAAKAEISRRVKKPYTCRICKEIQAQSIGVQS